MRSFFRMPLAFAASLILASAALWLTLRILSAHSVTTAQPHVDPTGRYEVVITEMAPSLQQQFEDYFHIGLQKTVSLVVLRDHTTHQAIRQCVRTIYAACPLSPGDDAKWSGEKVQVYCDDGDYKWSLPAPASATHP